VKIQVLSKSGRRERKEKAEAAAAAPSSGEA
jgi:hypothetical protein